MNIDAIALVVASLATWRLSSLLAREDGPWMIFAIFRRIIGVKYDALSRPFGGNIVAEGVICIWCNSVWIGLLLTVIYVIIGKALLWLILPFALSAIAIIVDELISKNLQGE